jgi:kinesin family protein 15
MCVYFLLICQRVVPVVKTGDTDTLSDCEQESEQDRSKLAENLSSLCTSILKVAGVVNPEPDASLLKALECLNQLQCRIPSLESEVEELKLKCKLLQEKARLSELRSDSSSLSSGAKDGSTSPGLSRSPSISSFR